MLPLPPSLYAATARPAPPTPPLPGDRRADVVVIGAGFTGLSTALHLAERGVDTVVLEANEPGWGASGRNGGQVNPGLKPDPDQVDADFGPELGARMVRFAWGAPETTFALIRRWQIACDARQGGTLRAAYQPGHAAVVRRSAEQGMRRGLPVTLLERDAALMATGTDRYVAVMRDASGGDVQPLDYARGLARAALQAGAAVHGGTRVTALSRADGRWQVATPTGTVTAETVILGTNGYTDDLQPGLRRSVVPVFSSIAATAPLAEAVVRDIMPMRASLYESGHITVYLRVDQKNRLLMGGRGPQRPIGDPSPVAYLMRYAERLWPALAGAEWTHGWNGQLAMTPDHYPHIHQPAPGLICCLGYNGRGIALSTAMGDEIARLATGTPAAEIAMPVTPIKPMPFHGFWRVGVMAKVLEGRIRDRLGL
ncbi:NAD(P)/FAD-dependent oxidoreductase [Plastoroseomonas hellenica]|uniref:NAD(P)/FAD-dependent oxidoreductase n=1 Tax=Plastoroseomonas hellenica TaxID=2687306 RepID=UPI001BA76760|nr:FAD-binding oxidoreductase [Plastoroseomonas hellenica]MBR0644928.1 FAD-binding oxidoreductase [Plastoroseomonas hellenica]